MSSHHLFNVLLLLIWFGQCVILQQNSGRISQPAHPCRPHGTSSLFCLAVISEIISLNVKMCLPTWSVDDVNIPAFTRVPLIHQLDVLLWTLIKECREDIRTLETRGCSANSACPHRISMLKWARFNLGWKKLMCIFTNWRTNFPYDFYKLRAIIDIKWVVQTALEVCSCTSYILRST